MKNKKAEKTIKNKLAFIFIYKLQTDYAYNSINQCEENERQP